MIEHIIKNNNKLKKTQMAYIRHNYHITLSNFRTPFTKQQWQHRKPSF